MTDAGRRFFEHSMQLLHAADAAVSAARAEQQEALVGELRVTTTVEYAEHMLMAALAEFSALHPRLHVQLSGLGLAWRADAVKAFALGS
jgi:DNA-binding transcriptional LysR family regulator